MTLLNPRLLSRRVWADHFCYISFPPSWPIYTPKDRLANWMEFYAESMELNVWLKSTIERNPTYDEATKQWTVSVAREGHPPRTMKVGHLVLATVSPKFGGRRPGVGSPHSPLRLSVALEGARTRLGIILQRTHTVLTPNSRRASLGSLAFLLSHATSTGALYTTRPLTKEPKG